MKGSENMNIMEADLMSDEIDLLMESSNMNFLEAGLFDIANDFSVFIKKILNTMKSIMKQLEIDIVAIIQKRQIKNKIMEMKKKIQDGTAPKELKLPDFEGAIKVYTRGIDSIEKELKNLMNYNCKDYKHVIKFCDRCDKFSKDVEEFTDKIDTILNDEYYMSPSSALEYIEDLIGPRNILQHYSKMCLELSKFENTSSVKIANKCLDAQNTMKAHREMQSVINKLSAKVSRSTRRLVMKIAFMFS